MKKNRKYIIWIGIVAILIAGYFSADSFLFNSVEPRLINDNGFQANYFVKKDSEKKAAIALITGG